MNAWNAAIVTVDDFINAMKTLAHTGVSISRKVKEPPNFVVINREKTEMHEIKDEPVSTDRLETNSEGKIQATKYDGDKPRFALIPVRAKTEVAKVFTYGAVKYDIGNWHAGDSFDYDRLQSASERHATAFAMGENIDPESGLHHLAHKICCDMMLLELVLSGHGKDNRNKAQYLPNFGKAVKSGE